MQPDVARGIEYDTTVIYMPLAEGGYQILVPVFPEIISYAPTIAEARELAADAIRCHISGLLKDGQEILADVFSADKSVIEQVKGRLRV